MLRITHESSYLKRAPHQSISHLTNGRRLLRALIIKLITCSFAFAIFIHCRLIVAYGLTTIKYAHGGKRPRIKQTCSIVINLLSAVFGENGECCLRKYTHIVRIHLMRNRVSNKTNDLQYMSRNQCLQVIN